jgi:hypothetical protein
LTHNLHLQQLISPSKQQLISLSHPKSNKKQQKYLLQMKIIKKQPEQQIKQ